MDPASQALAKGVPPGMRRTYATLAEQSNVPLSTLHHRARGRPSKEEKAQKQQYLTKEEEKGLVRFLLLMSDFHQPVQIKFLCPLAFRIACQRTIAKRPKKQPGRDWALRFRKRHSEQLKARTLRPIDWKRHDKNVYEKIAHWFELIGSVLQDPSVLPENVYNMDETGVMLSMLGSVKVLVGKDDQRNYRGVGVKREMVTAVECISADGRALLPMIIWPASTHRSNWTTYPTPGWHYAHSENGYNDSKISLEWLKRVFDAQTRERANGRPRVLICDGFGTHETLEILEYCIDSNIILCILPSHTSHKTQPCDVGAFAPLKAAYRDQVERLYHGGAATVGKEHFTSLYSPARDKAFSKKNIKAAWSASGLFPFNPDRVLKDIPKPTANPVALTEIEVRSCAQDEQVETSVILASPITPVTTEGIASLHDMIKQDAQVLDESSKQRLHRHVQKLASAAQTSVAEGVLLKTQNRFLCKMNSEAKKRRAAKSNILGKAKVMSYAELAEARAKRATKEKAAEKKTKRGRKGKAPVP